MALLKDLKPFKIYGPGEHIKENIELNNWTQEDLATIIGISPKHLNNIIQHKQSISLDIAKDLAIAFEQSPQFWVNLDTNFRIKIDDGSNNGEDVKKKRYLFKSFPISEMIKRKWLKVSNAKNADLLQNSLSIFWKTNIQNEDDILNIFKSSVAFRKSELYNQFNINYAKTWLQRAKNLAYEIEITEYKRNKLEKLVNDFNKYTIIENGVTKFLKELENLGIIFINLKHLPKTYIDGATFFNNGNPVIVYSGRYNRTDHFWFTLAHEIGHILKHLDDKRELIDDEKLKNKNSKIELEADEFASILLKHNQIYDFLIKEVKYLTKKRILECSQILEVSEGVIVGYLAHKKLIDYKNLHKYSSKIIDLIPIEYQYE